MLYFRLLCYIYILINAYILQNYTGNRKPFHEINRQLSVKSSKSADLKRAGSDQDDHCFRAGDKLSADQKDAVSKFFLSGKRSAFIGKFN